MIVVSDATVLIGLSKIDKIGLLKALFGKVYIPEGVFYDVAAGGARKPGSDVVKEARWIERKAVADDVQVRFLMTSLDQGEAEVLVLSRELNADLVLADEEKVRKSAAMAGFRVMGVVGVLISAKRAGFIGEVKYHIEDLRKNNFRLGDNIISMALEQAGEK